jgi:hypothetical protein
MICDVRDCTELAKYLVKIGNVSFNVCEEHNKEKWRFKLWPKDSIKRKLLED